MTKYVPPFVVQGPIFMQRKRPLGGKNPISMPPNVIPRPPKAISTTPKTIQACATPILTPQNTIQARRDLTLLRVSASPKHAYLTFLKTLHLSLL
jgi:hypothetical protein